MSAVKLLRIIQIYKMLNTAVIKFRNCCYIATLQCTGDESRSIYHQHISNLNHILKFKNLFKNCLESLNFLQRGEMTHLKYKQILEPRALEQTQTTESSFWKEISQK